MRVVRVLLSIGATFAIAGTAVPAVAGARAAGGLSIRRLVGTSSSRELRGAVSRRRARHDERRPDAHAHRATKKPHTEVWTLGEYVKGKAHKVRNGTSFYGRIAQTTLLFSQKRENANGFKWVENRPLHCGASAVHGTIVSNGVASPEIAIESITGALEREAYCPEEARHHPHEDIELFNPWMSATLKLKGLPMSLTLQPPHEGQNEALLAPTSYFEIEVESMERTVCKYFYIPKIKGQVSPSGTHEANQLVVRQLIANVSPETFTGQCPEQAELDIEIAGFAGEYGPALFASYK